VSGSHSGAIERQGKPDCSHAHPPNRRPHLQDLCRSPGYSKGRGAAFERRSGCCILRKSLCRNGFSLSLETPDRDAARPNLFEFDAGAETAGRTARERALRHEDLNDHASVRKDPTFLWH